ncbi:oxidoreductase [Methylobacterium sp. C25]|uniref:oxidoreductase n=1 Tax=Methylobacterium sp. C25 TaxID=2721622 RepID=UPI002D7F388F|nr:oxidoreductase [Methylobacterium sp. C25]
MLFAVVYGAARRVDRMSEIEAAGGHALAMDVTDDATMVSAVGRIIGEQRRIDVLINNAGYGQYGALEDVTLDDARKQMEINLFGLGRLTQLCLPHMRARQFGRIFNVSSIGGRLATPLGGWYHASKFALEGYSDALRMEVRPFGIDVVVIEPGGVESEWSGIATREAERISGNGAYAGLVAKAKTLMTGQKGASPRAITDLIVKGIHARTPRTRYHGGMMAGTMLFLRAWLSDRMLDRLIMMALR